MSCTSLYIFRLPSYFTVIMAIIVTLLVKFQILHNTFIKHSDDLMTFMRYAVNSRTTTPVKLTGFTILF